MVVPPIILFLRLVFPLNFKLEASPELSGVNEAVDNPEFLILYLYNRLGLWNPSHNLIFLSAGQQARMEHVMYSPSNRNVDAV